jgi:hypothetical protein
MSVLKHVGRHNNKKVAIVYRTVPSEDHMALVLYTESIPSLIHDEAMKCLESEIGQQAKELADALFRHTMSDGNNCLETIHRGGYLKKVPTKQVIVTVNSTSSCRLDELNDILAKMEQGEEAVKRLADLDASQGFKGGRDLGEPVKTSASDVNTTSADILSDADIARQRLEQANKMEAEAKGLLAEAKRLKEEVKSLTPTKAKNVRATKKATA